MLKIVDYGADPENFGNQILDMRIKCFETIAKAIRKNKSLGEYKIEEGDNVVTTPAIFDKVIESWYKHRKSMVTGFTEKSKIGGRFVLLDKNNVVGEVGFTPSTKKNTAKGSGLYISPSHQGRGHGKMMQYLVERCVVSKGMNTLEGDSLVYVPTINRHNKAGYKITDNVKYELVDDGSSILFPSIRIVKTLK